MRIAVVSPYALDVPGGVQAQVIELAAQLRFRDHEATVIGPGAGSLEHSVDVGGSVGIPANGAIAPVAVNPASWARVRKALATAELVHVHEPLMPIVGWAALRGDAPRVLTFHADPSDAVRRVYRAAGPLIRRGIRNAGAVTAVSPLAASAVEPLASYLDIVPNALDVAGYAVGVERHPQRVAFLGRPDRRKGRDVLLEAWPHVRGRHPGAELVVMGGGDAPDIDGVRFAGRVDEHEKRHLLASASIFCAPNRGGESFGITVAEGMAAGCAVVASDLAAFRHVLDGTGAHFANGDALALARELGDLLDDGQRRNRLAAASSARVRAFDWSVVVDRYLDIYTRATGSA